MRFNKVSPVPSNSRPGHDEAAGACAMDVVVDVGGGGGGGEGGGAVPLARSASTPMPRHCIDRGVWVGEARTGIQL